MADTLKAGAILLKFFGKLDGQTTADFAKELRDLSVQERNELAEMAAKEMGVEVDHSSSAG